MTLDATRYLAAKRTVDDRALNRQVLSGVRATLPAGDLRVLEVGGGSGTMVSRLLDWQVVERGVYTLVDVDQELLDAGRRRLLDWGTDRGMPATTTSDGIRLGGLDVRFVCHDLTDPDSTGAPEADLLIANAVLDIVDVPAILPGLLARLAPRGSYWFTITYDGECSFQPEHPLDDPVLTAYHRDMDHRTRRGRRAGERRAGRHLLPQLRAAGAPAWWAGASDWVVFPGPDGTYPHDERYFLDCILATIEAALTGRVAGLDGWLRDRRRQLEAGELVYVAHQLDVAGRAPSRGVGRARESA